jgi:hypothetical protein
MVVGHRFARCSRTACTTRSAAARETPNPVAVKANATDGVASLISSVTPPAARSPRRRCGATTAPTRRSTICCVARRGRRLAGQRIRPRSCWTPSRCGRPTTSRPPPRERTPRIMPASPLYRLGGVATGHRVCRRSGVGITARPITTHRAGVVGPRPVARRCPVLRRRWAHNGTSEHERRARTLDASPRFELPHPGRCRLCRPAPAGYGAWPVVGDGIGITARPA